VPVLRTPLSQAELSKLASLFREICASMTAHRKTNPLACHIQFPKLPPTFSESIAAHCVESLFPGAKKVRLGGGADIQIEIQGANKKVEVKATQKGFQHLSQKDISADYLVWIDFADCFHAGNQRIKIYVLPDPKTIFTKSGRITMNTFLRAAAGKLTRYEAEIDHLIAGTITNSP
jgi:hypothetical protein